MYDNAKVNRVIDSCKTEGQAKCAEKYIELAEKNKLISPVYGIYWRGVLTGIAHVNKWEYL